MAGVAELGAMATMACSATSSLGLAAYGHIMHGKERDKNHVVDKCHRHEGPLRKEGVRVSVDHIPTGRKGLEFNGEVLCITSDDGKQELVPAITLGGADVKVEGMRVIIKPPVLSTIVLDFPNKQDAEKWSSEMSEAIKVGAPHERIQELLMHSLRVEKHIADLRNRAATATNLQKENKKIQKQLNPSGSTGADPVDALQAQVREHEERKEKVQALAEVLRKQMDEHVAPEDHNAVHEQMQFHKEQSTQAKEEVARLRKMVDDLMPVVLDAQSQAQASAQKDGGAFQRQELDAQSEQLKQEFAKRYKDAQMQLASCEQRGREEAARCDMQATQADNLFRLNNSLRDQIDQLQASRRLIVQTGGARSQASTERFVDNNVEQKGQSVEEILIAKHQQLEAQRTDFSNQLTEQKRQHEIEISELREMHEKSKLAKPTSPTSVPPVSIESDLRLSLKASDLAQENSRLKDQLAEQEADGKPARKSLVTTVYGDPLGNSGGPTLLGAGEYASLGSSLPLGSLLSPSSLWETTPRMQSLVSQDGKTLSGAAGLASPTVVTTTSTGRASVARWISSGAALPQQGLTLSSPQGLPLSPQGLSDSRKSAAMSHDIRTLSSTQTSTASSVKTPPRTTAGQPPPPTLRQFACLEHQRIYEQLEASGALK